jgi:hypothetical protein
MPALSGTQRREPIAWPTLAHRCSARTSIPAAEAAGIRAIALALASDIASRDSHTLEVFLAGPATITLLQQRKQARPEIGESIILALA